ncbi:MAG: hypothetical protein IJG81_04115 [Muribaculaceae bacterium]|nr:hypothetical protein [Muribaculaceae bacterium]
MKKSFILFAIIVIAFTAQASTYYGFKIGGVAVNSDNYSNVKGSNIKAYDTSKPYSVVYNPSTKTVTLNNVIIERTGNDNRCIYNENCDGLTVFFSTSDSYLSSTTCAPIRLEANTTFTCEALVQVSVHGTDGDANCLYATDGATVTFDHATFYMYLTGNSNPAISCSSTTNEKIVFHHSRVSARSAGGSALSRFSSVTSNSSALLLRTGSETAYAMSNVKSFTMPTYPIMTIGYNNSISSLLNYSYTGTATFSTSKQTFVTSNNHDLPGMDIIISQRIIIDETTFPDATLRSWLSQKYNNDLETYEIFEIRTINVETSGNAVLKNVEDWTGINYLVHLRRLWVQGGKTTTLRLHSNREFYHLRCYDNPLGIEWAGLASSINPVPSDKEGIIEGFDVTTAEHNPLPTRSQLANIKSNGFDFIVKNGTQSYSLNALQDYWPLDYAHFPDDAFRSYLHSTAWGLDAVVYDDENTKITGFDIKNMNIADLKGIEGFKNITHLYCYQNKLSTLNLSQNSKLTLLYCYWNKIKSEGWDQFITNAPTFTTRLDVYCYYPSSAEQNEPPTYQQVAQAKAKNIHFYQRVNYGWEEMSDTPPIIPGDVNGDGHVSSVDVTALYNYLLNSDDSNMVNGDQDGDGHVSSVDVTVVYNILLGN